MDGTQIVVRRQGAHATTPDAARRRVVIERMQPELDAGRVPIKRTVGESVTVTVDIFGDGHDLLAGVVKYRKVTPLSGDAVLLLAAGADPGAGADPAMADTTPWSEVPITPIDNDAWTGTFTVTALGSYEYTVEAWVDRFGSWLKELIAKTDAGQDVSSELLEGAALVQAAAGRDGEGLRLLEIADLLRAPTSQDTRVVIAREPALREWMNARPDRATATEYDRILRVTVDPVGA